MDWYHLQMTHPRTTCREYTDYGLQCKDCMTAELEIEYWKSALNQAILDKMSAESKLLECKDILGKLVADRCKEIVPGSFLICGEDKYQYCSDECELIARL